MQRRSLHVGVNRYPDSPLYGCVNDAIEWRQAATARGYTAVELVDHQATRDAIVDQLETHLASLRMGDRFLFTYSGHGSYVADRDGDEADRRDEILCPVDIGEGRWISDDDLHRVFSKRRLGVVVTVISDSCYSGTVSRFAPSSTARIARPRFLPPDQFLDGAQLAATRAVQNVPAKGIPRPGVVLLSACRDDEVSWDAYIAGRYNGAFTRAAVDTLDESRSMRVWHDAATRAIDQASTPQHPQLTAGPWQALRTPLR